MTSLFRTRARAEEFAALVDGRIAAEDASAESRALVGVAAALRAPEQVTPRAEFSADLRERLLAEAATVLTPSNASLVLPARPRGSRERKLVALAAAFVVVGGSASMATAAQSALPGEALYPIKRGIEHAQAGLATSSASKGRDLLAQADDRLTEAQGLLAGGSTGTLQVPGTIADFTSQAQEGSGLLMQSFQSDRDPATIVDVRTFAAHGVTALQDLARTAPPEAQSQLARAATALADIDAQARGLCSTCATDLPDLDVPPMFLAAAEVDRALRSATVDKLDNSHPVVTDQSLIDSLVGALPLPKPGATSSPGSSPSAPASQPADPNPTSLLPKLPGADSSTKTGTTDLGRTVEKLTGDLSSPVSTLLPDSSPDNLLP
ncbi:MAG: DUF5667 domain-containing protein [Nocardioides sp.]